MNCFYCNKEATIVKQSKVLYHSLTVDHVYLRNCEVEVCGHCGSQSPVIRYVKKVHSMIALGLALQPAKLDGNEVKFLRKAMRQQLSDWAGRVGIAVGTFSKWENGRSPAVQVEKLARVDF